MSRDSEVVCLNRIASGGFRTDLPSILFRLHGPSMKSDASTQAVLLKPAVNASEELADTAWPSPDEMPLPICHLCRIGSASVCLPGVWRNPVARTEHIVVLRGLLM